MKNNNLEELYNDDDEAIDKMFLSRKKVDHPK
jgi:hypothetical protein